MGVKVLGRGSLKNDNRQLWLFGKVLRFKRDWGIDIILIPFRFKCYMALKN